MIDENIIFEKLGEHVDELIAKRDKFNKYDLSFHYYHGALVELYYTVNLIQSIKNNSNGEPEKNQPVIGQADN